jgi:phosphoribosyl-dephospho-CoA transferase
MRDEYAALPHDLVWGQPLFGLTDEAPGWVGEVVRGDSPWVVRRARAPVGQVAVGMRGPARGQRYATFMALAQMRRIVRPEHLIDAVGRRPWPALQALAWVRPWMNATGLVWGVGGSAGFELASGVAALHAASDLDLILRTPCWVGRPWAAELVRALDDAPCRIDVQLQTPAGGVALREWAGASRQVLLKGDDAARLVEQPWSRAACAPRYTHE